MTKIFCHRGYSGRYPENTMLAFEKALETPTEGIELDVHLTRDGQVVVFHDERLDRVTDGTGFLKNYTLAELKKLDASGKFRGQVPAQGIPTLEEYFQLVKPTAFITNIEFKTGMFDYPGIEQKVLELIGRYGLEDRVMFSSFRVQTLLRLKELAPGLPCGFLRQSKLKKAGQIVTELGLEAYHPFFLQLKPSVVRALKEHGRQINTYTPNGYGTLGYLLLQNVDSVITNFPDRAVKLRRLLQREP